MPSSKAAVVTAKDMLLRLAQRSSHCHLWVAQLLDKFLYCLCMCQNLEGLRPVLCHGVVLHQHDQISSYEAEVLYRVSPLLMICQVCCEAAPCRNRRK
jgi:hypothetical protein